jgi:hypothetical protein
VSADYLLSIAAGFLLALYAYSIIIKFNQVESNENINTLVGVAGSYLSIALAFFITSIYLGGWYSLAVLISSSLFGVSGLIYEKISGKECGCFGVAGGSGKATESVYKWAIIILSLILLTGFSLKSCEINKIVQFSAAVALCTFLLYRSRLHLLSKSTPERPTSRQVSQDKVSPQRVMVLNTEIDEAVLGLGVDGQLVTYRTIKNSPIASFLVVISSSCKHCQTLLPDLQRFADAFKDKLTIYVISDADGLNCQSTVNIKNAHIEQLKEAYNANGYPFAAAFPPNSVAPIGPVSVGPKNVRLLFSLVLSILAE